MYETIKYEVKNGIGYVTISRPKALNAINSQVLSELYKVCREIEKDDNVKVVILGQGPYHGPNQAEGLSFSVSNEVLKPPSLQNIFKELESDIGIQFPAHNSLKPWAKQGVLLLNAVLTVEEHKPTSHKEKGWETFTDDIIEILNKREDPIVFILWGSYARNKKKLITNQKHLIIESAHPSPFSARNGFFGSKPFSKTNEFLKKNGKEEIDWRIE